MGRILEFRSRAAVAWQEFGRLKRLAASYRIDGDTSSPAGANADALEASRESPEVILPDVGLLWWEERERRLKEGLPPCDPPVVSTEEDESDYPHHYPGGPAGRTPGNATPVTASSLRAESGAPRRGIGGFVRVVANRVRLWLAGGRARG